jgi:hypothetical protein
MDIVRNSRIEKKIAHQQCAKAEQVGIECKQIETNSQSSKQRSKAAQKAKF